MISVAAIDESYQVADFSQYNDLVDLAAPGVNVLSTLTFLALLIPAISPFTFTV